VTKRPKPPPTKEPHRAAPVAAPVEVSQNHCDSEVRNNDDAFHKLKFKIPPFDGKYDHDAYISWEFPKNARVRAATSEFIDFASVWWVEYGKKHPDDIPQTWVALKWVMPARFVPSHYARDLINKLQQLKQGVKSVEEYYQELQLVCCIVIWRKGRMLLWLDLWLV
jgi:hypothetical protein